MAEVYLAEQLSLGRQVALKVLSHALASDRSYVERFQNEARAAASLVHPNIVQIFEVGQADGIHFIAQEYVAGKNLGQLLERQGAFQPALVLDVLRQVVSALCKAHEWNIVHRDIKPENILLSNSGEVKVADFGLARFKNNDSKTLTQVGVAMGTPLYMSPEQVEGRPVDVRSDLYSLGVSCYHLLAGVPPHTGETALAIAVQHLHNTPEPLENVRQDLPSSLARIIHKMLAKKPEARPASPSDLLVELRQLAKLAAQEGWAEGPDDWSLAEWIATEPTRSRKSEELANYMQAETKLKPRSRSWLPVAWGLAAATLVGALLGAVTRPHFYLAGDPRSLEQVPELESVWAQLLHAKLRGGEAAWRTAIKYPGDDAFPKRLAKQGLIRHYLLVVQDNQSYRAAIRELGELEKDSRSNPTLQLAHAFSLAGLCIGYERLDERAEALDAKARLDDDMIRLLREQEPQIYDLLQTSLRRLNASA